jgi:hypothetical protein
MNENYNKFVKFISDHKNHIDFTHNSKFYPSGKFAMNDNEVDTFNNLYINALHDNQPIYINEVIRKYMPILIDIDIKYLKSEVISDRVYYPILDTFVDIIIKIINKHLVVNDDNFLIFILEKDNPFETKKEFKDGIHIITPFIWIPYELIYIIRNDIIKELENIKLFDKIPHTNDINYIYDKVPYDQKLWLMFKSYDIIKNKIPYDLTKIYNKNLELQPINYTNDELIKLFSISKIKYEYIAKTKFSTDEILNVYKGLDTKIILSVFLRDFISDVNNFNYRNSYTNTYYNITDIPTFYTHLYNSINDGNVEYITQKTKEFGPIISDIDIYYDDPTIKKIYPPEFIPLISQIYIDVVEKYVNVSKENIQVFVLEKNRISIKNNMLYKDGLHIIMPFVCLSQENQYYIREKVIEEVAKLNIFDNSLLDRIFDKIVIKNYWTIYGCYNQDSCKYTLTNIYDYDLNSIDIEQYSLKELIDILNITKFSKDQINSLNMILFDSNHYNVIYELFNILLITITVIITIIFIILKFKKS